jgi:hypothetical protein
VGVPSATTAHAGVQALGNAFDGAAFSCGIAAFKEYDDFQSAFADPFLQFHEFNLQAAKVSIILAVFAQFQRLQWLGRGLTVRLCRG